MNKTWYGRLGYDNEGIVREREFPTEREAIAYAMGARDAIEQASFGCSSDEFNPLEDYWACSSNEESIEQ